MRWGLGRGRTIYTCAHQRFNEVSGEEWDGMGRDGCTCGMSLVLSATDASSVLPRSWGSEEEVVVWSGRGLEGMVRGVAESEGTVVPETAMSLRDPPCGLRSEGGDILVVVCVSEVGVLGGRIQD